MLERRSVQSVAGQGARDRIRCGALGWVYNEGRTEFASGIHRKKKGTVMLRLPLIGICLAVTLTGRIIESHNRTTKAVNTAMTGACLAARLYPCTIQPIETSLELACHSHCAVSRFPLRNHLAEKRERCRE
jgi:hypothetical protein